MINRKIQTLLILSTLVLSTFFAFPLLNFTFIQRAHATTSSCTTPPIANCLFIDPASMAVAAPGSTVTFNVKVASMDSFNGYDILIVTDANALSGLSISAPAPGTAVPGLGGAGGPGLPNLINCVEGGTGFPINTPGNTRCDLKDGPGVIHAASAYSQFSTAGGSGTLFQVNYSAGFALGAILSPTSSVFASAGTPVPISTASAVYGTPSPDFAASASSAVDQNGNPLQPGSEGQSVISVTSVGGFFDTLSLALSPSSAVSDFISPTSLVVPAGGAAAAVVSITVPLTTTPGTYHQTIAASGLNTLISHTFDMAIVVSQPQNAGLTCGSDISVVRGTTAANPVSITSQNGLFGGVFLSTAVSGIGVTATTDPPSVTVGNGGSSQAVLYVAADAAAPLGTSMVTLTANFGGVAPSTCSINVTVLAAGTADFTLLSSDSSLIAIRGVKYTSTITVGNVAGFTGTVSTSVVVLPLVDKGPVVTVSSVSGGTATLTFSSPPANVLATQLLTYKVVVIGRSGSQSHAVQVIYTLEDFGIQARGSGNFPEYVLTATECNAGKLSFGSLNGFSGTLTISRFRMVNINTGDLGFPTGVSFALNYSVGGPVLTADSTANHILGSTVTVTSGSFVAGTLNLCTTTDTPGGEYQLQIRAKITINGAKVENRKSIFVQINSFDLVPSTNFLVVQQKASGQVPISIVGAFVEDLCCSAGFGTFPFLDFVSLSVTSVSPNPALTSTKLTVAIAPGPYFTTDLINPTALLNVTVGPGGQGGLFAITVTGVAQQTPALQRSTTILVSVPSTIVQLPTGVTTSTSAGLVTFSASILNTASTAQFVQIVCSVVSRTPGGSVYSPQSAVVAVAAGGTATVTFTQATTAGDAGQSFNFLCHANFGTDPSALLFVTKDKGKGTFTAS